MMKPVIFLSIFLACTYFCSSQSPASNEKVYVKVEVEARFPGGDSAWRNYLQNSDELIKITEKAAETIKNGKYKVIVRFVVDRDGSISDINATTKHGHGLEEGAIEVIKKSGRWLPANHSGRSVKSYKEQPIIFIFEDESDPA